MSIGGKEKFLFSRRLLPNWLKKYLLRRRLLASWQRNMLECWPRKILVATEAYYFALCSSRGIASLLYKIVIRGGRYKRPVTEVMRQVFANVQDKLR
jgi:hypothetical protein